MKRMLKRDGNILISLVFMLLVFWCAFALLNFSVTHNRIVGARVMKIKETGKMAQDLIYYLHHFRQELFSGTFRQFGVPGNEYFNSDRFPETDVNQRHRVLPHFRFHSTEEAEFTRTRVIAGMDITPVPSPTGTGDNYHMRSEVVIDILAGKIPLTYIPFFLKNDVPGTPEQYLDDEKIVIKNEKEVVVDEVETEIKQASLVADTFNIPDVEIVLWKDIREKLGLDIEDGPVEDGIYLLSGAGFINAVFIQGDVEEIRFSVIDAVPRSIQTIVFILNSHAYEIQYQPGQPYFHSWDPLADDLSIFYETIIVNGNVKSIVQQGDSAFSRDSGIKLLVSGRAAIKSSLAAESGQLDLTKARLVHFLLSTGPGDLFNKHEGPDESGVTIDSTGKTEIEAAIITGGTFVNHSETLKLTGSIYAERMENNGTFELNYQESFFKGEKYFRTTNYKYIYRFLIDFIEEVPGD